MTLLTMPLITPNRPAIALFSKSAVLPRLTTSTVVFKKFCPIFLGLKRDFGFSNFESLKKAILEKKFTIPDFLNINNTNSSYKNLALLKKEF